MEKVLIPRPWFGYVNWWSVTGDTHVTSSRNLLEVFGGYDPDPEQTWTEIDLTVPRAAGNMQPLFDVGESISLALNGYSI